MLMMGEACLLPGSGSMSVSSAARLEGGDLPMVVGSFEPRPQARRRV